MPYTDFTLENVEPDLGVVVRAGVVFADLSPVAGPDWLPGQLARGMRFLPATEKGRSELIVTPILIAVCELTGDRVSILSGHRLDVDPGRKLTGECDFLLSDAEPLPRLKGPLLTVVEAKKNDVDAGLGQCVAQMVAAAVFNDRAGTPKPAVYGCVTTGHAWQFLRLAGPDVTVHVPQLFIDNVGLILAAFGRAVAPVAQQ